MDAQIPADGTTVPFPPEFQFSIEHGLCATEVAAVLESLPDWFGRPEAITAYAAEAETLEAVTARVAGELMGLLTLKPRSTATCEIAVMAVRPLWRRKGIGRSLCELAVDRMRSSGYAIALVQTVGPSIENTAYTETRAFYEAIGFQPLIEIADHFGDGVPGQLMVRLLQA